MNAEIEMPLYKPHDQVRAIEIGRIELDAEKEWTEKWHNGGATLHPIDPESAPVYVESDFMAEHQPAIGGYYTVSEDGYESYLFAKTFRERYNGRGNERHGTD